MNKITLFLSFSLMLGLITSCGKDSTGVFLFSKQDDIDLGAQVDAEIRSNPAEFPIIARSANAPAYAYLDAMRDEILNGGEVKFKDDFVWQLAIIDDPTTLNAFCTPGGYIYVYTGLINYLENSSSLAGVMGHEMAHADRRHSSSQLQQQYGLDVLLGLLSSTAGQNAELIGNVAASLTSLAFSRADETEADKYSVTYLCPTEYDAAGAAGFFQKIVLQGDSSTTAFMSTHPAPLNRVDKINTESASLECGTDDVDPPVNGVSYTEFKAMF